HRAGRPSGLKIIGRDGHNLVGPAACAMILVASGTLDGVSGGSKDVSWFGQLYRSAELGQRLKSDLAHDFVRAVLQQEIDAVLTERVSFVCSCKLHSFVRALPMMRARPQYLFYMFARQIMLKKSLGDH